VSQQERRGNPVTRLSLFLRQVVAELRKVVWPTRPQLITYFWVVLVFVVVVMTLVSLLDLAFGKLAFSLFA
jgi:preprotein translocase subunit SecE